MTDQTSEVLQRVALIKSRHKTWSAAMDRVGDIIGKHPDPNSDPTYDEAYWAEKDAHAILVDQAPDDLGFLLGQLRTALKDTELVNAIESRRMIVGPEEEGWEVEALNPPRRYYHGLTVREAITKAAESPTTGTKDHGR